MALSPIARRLGRSARTVADAVRGAIFGAERPRRAISRILKGPAEAIDPMGADIRAFGPAEGPEQVVIPVESAGGFPHASGEHRERSENSPRG